MEEVSGGLEDIARMRNGTHGRGEARGEWRDAEDADRGQWTVKEVARLLARISRYTHLRDTSWERHSGQTPT